MYVFLLSLRYLRTRYIALASVISVMLGVATMIVVNSVMSGFQNEMFVRLHGILSDVVVEAHSLDGIPDPDDMMMAIRDTLGSDVVAMTPSVQIPAMLEFKFRNQNMVKQIMLIGIDPETYAGVSSFGQYVLHPENKTQLDFSLREGGFDERLGLAGWEHRKQQAAVQSAYRQQLDRLRPAGEKPESSEAIDDIAMNNPFDALESAEPQGALFDPSNEQHAGIVVGIGLCSVRQRDKEGDVRDYFLLRPGDDVKVTFPSAGTQPKPIYDQFTVVDLYESKMSEYDGTFAFVPLSKLQQLRGMVDPVSGKGAATSVQIKLAEGADLNLACEQLRERFPAYMFPYQVQTWKQRQGPLMAAVSMETTLLNILLFFIIAVAGFGILATFYMTVIEKTRDIGILKSLGASSRGVMAIFLHYGVSLGCVGAGIGMLLGLFFVWNINRIAALIQFVTGREVFDPTVYYFSKIPTIVNPFTVAWIVAGALSIAMIASVLPAMRAARLHPVEALRYE